MAERLIHDECRHAVACVVGMHAVFPTVTVSKDGPQRLVAAESCRRIEHAHTLVIPHCSNRFVERIYLCLSVREYRAVPLSLSKTISVPAIGCRPRRVPGLS
jgi:hypothetical protein